MNFLSAHCFMILAVLSVVTSSRVLELSDKFIDISNEGMWFVKFYAPWCAHCRRIEPIWAHVAQSLYNSPIKVAKVDCTRFMAVATHFKVRAYPTIMFIKGPYRHEYIGERVKEDMVNYALRMSQPAVQRLSQADSLGYLKETHPVFFGYVGKQQGPLWVTRSNINELMDIEKYIVIAIVSENKLNEITQTERDFKDMVESIIKKRKRDLHHRFQFGWMGNPELANSIAMSELTIPHLIVLNSTTGHHHIPEDDPVLMTPEAVSMFLDQIHNQVAPTYGGNSWPVRFYRGFFEARTTLTNMWRGNPVLTALVFGLPLGFLSLICYSVCCADILDAEEEDTPETHEKKD
ncbi:hypothetical protein HW555_004310 [Spodoptera exigua]|uniref:Thioredoxin domain-containing protein n=1 Tax=Spodoptera exigua TaxID=7107 RepID=A0A835GL97_SPOEX|nr:hypothetical protein HW555_004310 [Spodoptera exigua]